MKKRVQLILIIVMIMFTLTLSACGPSDDRLNRRTDAEIDVLR